MSFTGDLEHLPIVDVIQLLHATKKSGTLSIRGRKGESQLVFDGGYIISANHLNDSLRIGNILIGTGAITSGDLDRTLQEQKNAGSGRKPLIAMLVEKEMVKKEAAFKALETLIELTIVEILTWTTGTFSLDVDRLAVSDEYRYFPEKLNQDFLLNTQNILMDALRIYDEKKRDGELAEEETAEEPVAGEDDASESWTLSADDLGLADLERLERKIPGVFASLEDVDPVAIQREQLRSVAAGLSVAEQEELLAYLRTPADREKAETAPPPGSRPQAVILFSRDELFTFLVTAACKLDGFPVFATNDEQDLDLIIDQSLAKKIAPILVIDTPCSPHDRTALVSLRQQKAGKYPRLSIVQLASPLESAFHLRSFAEGIPAILPRPAGGGDGFVSDAILFLQGFRRSIKASAAPPAESLYDRLRNGLASMHGLKEAPEVVSALMGQVAAYFERSLTLVVGQGELIAERGIGMKTATGAGATTPLGFRIPLAPSSILKGVTDEGALFCGDCSDAVLRERLFKEIGPPLRPVILLLPVRSRGKTVALTYADFGSQEVAEVPLALLETLAGQAGLLLENAFYRKKLEKNPQ